MYLRNITKLTQYLNKFSPNSNVRRNISSTTKLFIPGAYEASGQTNVQILNKDTELGIMINGFSQVGFRLNNDFTVLGSMVIFPRSVLSWNVHDVSEITEDTLSLFTILEPKIDILVIGVGDRLDNFDFYKNLLPFMRKQKIALEILPTESACSTFNFLNSEGRNVVGAMIPPKTFRVSEDDELVSKMRYQNLYVKE
ncbi:NADH dehydrogenase [ubiquinone] 1 alpha subcomplex assembly factor 3 [Diabrotica virgifera virgifera]|uniref:NADH dehydrogenase [ubiquinone] 1 alpha subcomplex assembly factor 3 n=2 Tax=Diabrotica virgifera virgifera TaxID=50390 RepID=A0ABM5IX66_DIAVI|nr:NADH dehydrogenase [ubiquinone] 1 alpha subcomplex assembly factor 3 [Diabrotica virgifera virgifera]